MFKTTLFINIYKHVLNIGNNWSKNKFTNKTNRSKAIKGNIELFLLTL
ncbi:MAG: hypothetical protein JWP12_2025 [Bacteroidetes bacterium]|nr:hypothetical protein [Bacteroidota bacterium]